MLGVWGLVPPLRDWDLGFGIWDELVVGCSTFVSRHSYANPSRNTIIMLCRVRFC